MATTADIKSLRAMLGESIPQSGNEGDTLFSDQDLNILIDSVGGNLELAAYEGWRNKAAQLANLVNVTDGAASREFSDLHDQALEMVKLYLRSSAGPTEGRTRIGRIVRR